MADLNEVDQYDVVVVGGGVAGLTAALFASRMGLQTRVLCPEGPGGALLSIEAIEDLPGFLEPVAGFEFCPTLQEQAQKAGATFDMASLTGLNRGGESGWSLQTDAGKLRASVVIISTGTTPRPLGIPGEAEFIGRGVSHCASCDGPLYAGKDVVVIGHGDAAYEEALTLERCGARATILHAVEHPSAMATYRNRVEESSIVVRARTRPLEITGDSTVSGLRVDENGSITTLPASGVFVYVGGIPTAAIVGDAVDLDESGRIVTDSTMRTRSPGLLAAGDVRAGTTRRFAVMAAGDGATAAVSAAAYLGIDDPEEWLSSQNSISEQWTASIL